MRFGVVFHAFLSVFVVVKLVRIALRLEHADLSLLAKLVLMFAWLCVFVWFRFRFRTGPASTL